jgi:DNA (cytosine-5)-methyltransferase 1
MGKKLTFIDLFAGIGGFHLALKSLDMKCVFACEIDKYARQTYLKNFNDGFLKDPELFPEDIWSVDIRKIPDFDLLCGGFPCQPFSQAGYKRGFKDNRNGNLFFSISDILKIKKPKVYILENVSHLKNHDNGRTFKKIYTTLRNLNYTFDYRILRASDYGLPQHRPRVFMVGFYKPLLKSTFEELGFTFPRKIKLKKTISDVFGGFCSKDLAGKRERRIGFTLRVGGGRSPIMDRRNWDGYIVDKKVIRIKPKQGLKMMGFPKTFGFPVSDHQALKQLGNSVAVNVVKEVGKEVLSHLDNYSK